MELRLLPIGATAEADARFAADPACRELLDRMGEFYKKVGYAEPWIGYFAEADGVIVGSAGFKGAPVNGWVEIAYGTDEPFRRRGVATEMCGQLVSIALETEPTVIITAHTRPDNFASARVLEKNGFVCTGRVVDPEDGEVLQWVYIDRSRSIAPSGR
jgi:ribosomal-protein-alanine N-acetyltransferase